jgi:hypothetical protein
MRNLRIVILALTAGAIFTLSASPAAVAGQLRSEWQTKKQALVAAKVTFASMGKEDLGPLLDKFEEARDKVDNNKGQVINSALGQVNKSAAAVNNDDLRKLKGDLRSAAMAARGAATTYRAELTKIQNTAAKDAADWLRTTIEKINNRITQSQQETKAAADILGKTGSGFNTQENSKIDK